MGWHVTAGGDAVAVPGDGAPARVDAGAAAVPGPVAFSIGICQKPEVRMPAVGPDAMTGPEEVDGPAAPIARLENYAGADPRVKKNSAPASGSPSAQQRPPCRSTIRCTMARPTPVPS